jgi:hypothetical protein
VSPVYPLPPGRLGPWRFSLHQRLFVPSTQVGPKITDLVDARTRRVEFKMNQPAVITFTVPGASPTAAEILELGTDVVAYRWNERFNRDDAMCQACVTQSQDTITEQTHTVAFNCQDYIALLKRRITTYGDGAFPTYGQQDQDVIVASLVNLANNTQIWGPDPATIVGSDLSISTQTVQPNGASRGNSGRLRDRTYYGNQNIWDAIYNLSQVENGFDLSMAPGGVLKIWYPSQGVLNTSFLLDYGSTVSGVQRSINSATYANYVRSLARTNTGTGSQEWGEAYTDDALYLSNNPVGLWMHPDSATDLGFGPWDQLRTRARGIVGTMGLMVAEGARGKRVPLPSYTLTLRPGAYYAGAFNMGDTLRLQVRSGRLNINTLVQVVGITFVIGDDGQEDVLLDVGTPPADFVKLMANANVRVSSLERKPT